MKTNETLAEFNARRYRTFLANLPVSSIEKDLIARAAADKAKAEALAAEAASLAAVAAVRREADEKDRLEAILTGRPVGDFNADGSVNLLAVLFGN